MYVIANYGGAESMEDAAAAKATDGRRTALTDSRPDGYSKTQTPTYGFSLLQWAPRFFYTTTWNSGIYSCADMEYNGCTSSGGCAVEYRINPVGLAG
jgi:hypothetical protein